MESQNGTAIGASEISVNPSITDSKNCKTVTLDQVFQMIRTGGKHKERIDQVRQCEDKAEANKLKSQLPVIIFGGVFSRRANSELQKASGLMVLDFDCDTQLASEAIRERLENDEYIYAYFKSTRGLGYKALIKIPVVESDEEYKEYWFAVNKRYPEIDTQCKEISRACFYTYDPEIKINEKAKVWQQKSDSEKKVPPVQKLPGKRTRLENRILGIIRRADQGERHNMILRASRVAGGYVGSGAIDYTEIQRKLEDEAYNVAPEEFNMNRKAVEDGLNNGMQDPIYDEKVIAEVEQEQIGKIHYTLFERRDSIWEKYEHGINTGYTVGHKSVDQAYKIIPGYYTTLYGGAFTGKSQLWMHFLINLSHRYGCMHAVFSPETGDVDDIFITLMELYIGKDFYDTGYGKMTPDEVKDAREFVEKYFMIIDPGVETVTFDLLVDTVKSVEDEYNMKFATVTIDPWNDLHHDIVAYGGRDDRYLEEMLKKVRVTAWNTNWHICIITHTAQQQYREKEGVRFVPPPSFRDIAGGQVWNRRGFQMCAVWRPPNELTEFNDEPLYGNEVFFLVQKYKPKWAGENSRVKLFYNEKNKTYYEWSHTAGSIYPDLTRQTETSKPEPQPQPQQSEEVPF